MEVFSVHNGQSKVISGGISPLVEQAQAYARLLNSPKVAERPSIPVRPVSFASATPPGRPTASFRLEGVCYHRAKPVESMALVCESNGGRRWVKQGARLGPFVVHEIGPDRLVYRAGEQLREIVLNRDNALPHVETHAGGVARASRE
ncbi:MAG: hypothetical protein A2Y77_17015 [Planctomycetes bacterium RBG_13_62_9]|nr:MAG: hypothetical protein A2Y77_17015 [Planctomycetes bacterium RBG_13_62_9]